MVQHNVVKDFHVKRAKSRPLVGSHLSLEEHFVYFFLLVLAARWLLAKKWVLCRQEAFLLVAGIKCVVHAGRRDPPSDGGVCGFSRKVKSAPLGCRCAVQAGQRMHTEGRKGLVAHTHTPWLQLFFLSRHDSAPTKHSCRAGRQILLRRSPLLHS